MRLHSILLLYYVFCNCPAIVVVYPLWPFIITINNIKNNKWKVSRSLTSWLPPSLTMKQFTIRKSDNKSYIEIIWHAITGHFLTIIMEKNCREWKLLRTIVILFWVARLSSISLVIELDNIDRRRLGRLNQHCLPFQYSSHCAIARIDGNEFAKSHGQLDWTLGLPSSHFLINRVLWHQSDQLSTTLVYVCTTTA